MVRCGGAVGWRMGCMEVERVYVLSFALFICQKSECVMSKDHEVVPSPARRYLLTSTGVTPLVKTIEEPEVSYMAGSLKLTWIVLGKVLTQPVEVTLATTGATESKVNEIEAWDTRVLPALSSK